MTPTEKIQILRDALTDERAWLEAQRKAISKGCGSSWDMGQCDERMGLIDAALRLTEGAPEKIDTEKLATLVRWFVDGVLPEDMFWNVQVTAEVLRRAFPIAHRAAVEDAPGEAVADNRRCKPCGATRGGTHCWKCGAETFEPSPLAGDDPRLPPIDRIRELAREVGYAIGVHGSQQRDLDVIAAPWTDMAIGNHALIEHIAKGLMTGNGPARIVEVERKPLGRYAATIQMDGWYKQLDISVCPNSQYESLRHPAPTPTAEVPAPKASTEPAPTDAEKFRAHLKASSEAVKHWPIWKQKALTPPIGSLVAQPKSAEPAPKSAEAEEDAALIKKLGGLLAEIAIVMKGPEPARKRWSYHDLPELVGVMKAELEIYKLASVEHAKRAEFSGEREALFDKFLREEAPLDYDASNSDAWHIWQAAWQARGRQQAGVPDGWQAGRADLNEFIAKVCGDNSQLIACAESAFYWFNKCIAASHAAPEATP